MKLGVCRERLQRINGGSNETDEKELTVLQLTQDLEGMDARDSDAGKYAMILRQLYARHARRNIQTNDPPEAVSEAS